MELKEKREKLGALIDETRKTINKRGIQTIADREKINATMEEIEELKIQINIEARQQNNENYANQIQPGTPPPYLDDDDQIGGLPSGHRNISGRGRNSGAEKRSYRGMFGNPESSNDFENIGEFASLVSGGRADERLLRAMQEGVPSDGGFSVPQTFTETIFNSSLEKEVVRPRATVYGIKSGNTRTVPATVIGDHSSNLFGGLTATWGEEGGTLTDNPPKLRDLKLKAKKLFCYCEASNEWLQDSVEGSEFIEKA